MQTAELQCVADGKIVARALLPVTLSQAVGDWIILRAAQELAPEWIRRRLRMHKDQKRDRGGEHASPENRYFGS